LAQQLAEKVAVERERLGPPLRRGRVVLVHVVRDVVEEERGGVGRGRRRLDVDEVDLPRAKALQEPPQRGQVEDVLQALAIGLENDREGGIAARDLQKRLRLQPLLPKRRALAWPAARDQECTARVLAEARAEERRLPQLVRDELLHLLRIEQHVLDRRSGVRVREVDRDPVVRPDLLRLEAE